MAEVEKPTGGEEPATRATQRVIPDPFASSKKQESVAGVESLEHPPADAESGTEGEASDRSGSIAAILRAHFASQNLGGHSDPDGDLAKIIKTILEENEKRPDTTFEMAGLAVGGEEVKESGVDLTRIGRVAEQELERVRKHFDLTDTTEAIKVSSRISAFLLGETEKGSTFIVQQKSGSRSKFVVSKG